MKNKKTTFKIIGIVLLLTFLMIFFFEIIPIPTKNMDKPLGNGKYEIGFYFTSIIYQLQTHNYFVVFLFCCLFGMFFFYDYYFCIYNKKEKWQKK